MDDPLSTHFTNTGTWGKNGPFWNVSQRDKRILRAILVLLIRLSAGRFNLVIIFRPRSDLPAEPHMHMLRYTMIPANCADKFKGLKIADNSFTEVDLPANDRQQNNYPWNGRAVYWFGKTNMINWLLHVLTATPEINSSTVCSKRWPISASYTHACAVAERWSHLSGLTFIYFSSGDKDLPLVSMTIFIYQSLRKPRTYESIINNKMSCSFWKRTKNPQKRKDNSVKTLLFTPQTQFFLICYQILIMLISLLTLISCLESSMLKE